MKKIQQALLIGAAPVCILGAAAGTALAWSTSSGSTNNCNNDTVQPYNGGGSVSKFFNMADGSGVTITSTGAVIKQSPCGTPYREGWVNPGSISGINSSSQIPQLRSGATNPYVVKTNSTNTSSSSSSQNKSTSSSTNASASATVNVTGTPQVAAASTTQPSQTSTSSTSTSATSGKGATTLPNTGPGNILALGAVTAAVGTIGHFLYRTLRFRWS